MYESVSILLSMNIFFPMQIHETRFTTELFQMPFTYTNIRNISLHLALLSDEIRTNEKKFSDNTYLLNTN